jgi:hypothetical protein
MNRETNPSAPLSTPILLLVFNRPELTRRVFNEVRKAKPSKLYIAADGPRPNNIGDIERCAEVKKIVSNVDWHCEVRTLFRSHNLGCGPAVKSAIDFFFDKEEWGIILEDDTVPVQSFFWFCQELLDRYKNDMRIGMIAGTNHIDYRPSYASYLFSRNKACWGWATWRRAWVSMDFNMQWRHSDQAKGITKNMGISKYNRYHWLNAQNLIDQDKVSTWDWQWYFSLAAQNQLTIFPEDNLVKNIGFGADSTHTSGKPNEEYIKTNEINFPLSHPSYICPDLDFDMQFERKKMSVKWSIGYFIPKWVKSVLRKII